MYLTNTSVNYTVSAIDTSVNRVINNIPVADEPFGISFNPNNKRVYVTNAIDNTVSVIVTEQLPDQNNHYNYQLSPDKQLINQDDNNDTYYKLLLDGAERFFNERVKELTHVCISRLDEVCISASMSS